MCIICDYKKGAIKALRVEGNNLFTPAEFIEHYAAAAMQQQRKYGIPSSVILAQMALESKWGNSNLAQVGYNFFGIKANQSWLNSGLPYSIHDDDRPNEKFCNFLSPEESIEYHSRLLMSDRYARCWRYKPTDYHNWLLSIKAAGYATRKDYVKVCERIIRQHKLYLYTSALAGRPRTTNINYLVGLLAKAPTKLTIYGKANSAVILAQYGQKTRANEYLQSLKEYTVYKEETGRYFDTPKDRSYFSLA